MTISDSYLIQCKANWFLGIRPSDHLSKNSNEYSSLIKIAKTYFENEKYQEFRGFFMESQYLIPLWTAHLILEFGLPTNELKAYCLKVIKEYTNNPLANEVAIQEKNWLDNYTNENPECAFTLDED